MTLRAVPKPQRMLVSPKLRQSARGRGCTVRWHGCDGGGETTVLAHIRGTWAGVAQKPGDHFAVYACFACHRALDRVDGAGPVPDRDVLRALYETQAAMIADGLISVGRT